MSTTVQRVNFEPKSDLFLIQTRDFPVADATLLDPRGATAIVDTPGNAATLKSAPVWAELGRSDVQSIRKLTTFHLGIWEADTRIFDAAAVVGGGAAITFIGQLLKVATITLGSRNYTGLVGAVASDIVVATVADLPANNGGKLRIKAVAP